VGKRIGQVHGDTLDCYRLLRREPGAGLSHRVPPQHMSREEICGFDLHLVDGTVITVYYGDAGFDQVSAQLSEQSDVLALGPVTSE
jgi:hypothetical protein